MVHTKPSIAGLVNIEQPIDVVDIGANPIDGNPPYKTLIDAGLAHLVGFEPNPEAIDRLNAKKGENEIYLPKAVYDGTEQTLKVCAEQGMSSLLEPNAKMLSYFHGFSKWGTVLERRKIQTVRLDDIEEIENIDLLKIDVQGGELEIFRNGLNRLRDCLIIHTEVEFLPMYEGQPLFSEVEQFLRKQGFLFHCFAPLVSKVVSPLLINDDVYAGINQNFWADAVFIKDFTKFDQLSPNKLQKLAVILHDVYGSYDIALRALMARDDQCEDKLAEKYPQLLV